MPRDRGKIMLGLVLFVGLCTLPFWLRPARGKSNVPLDEKTGRPQLVMPANEKACVEPVAYMRAAHMDLLNTWRDGFVRLAKTAEGRTWHSADGRSHKMSLTGSCLKCHDKANFCDRCHTFMGESPYCFDCHHTSPTATSLQPQGAQAGAAGR